MGNQICENFNKTRIFICPTKQKYDYLVQDDLNPKYNPFKEELSCFALVACPFKILTLNY